MGVFELSDESYINNLNSMAELLAQWLNEEVGLSKVNTPPQR
jgi:hypothetical protein